MTVQVAYRYVVSDNLLFPKRDTELKLSACLVGTNAKHEQEMVW